MSLLLALMTHTLTMSAHGDQMAWLATRAIALAQGFETADKNLKEIHGHKTDIHRAAVQDYTSRQRLSQCTKCQGSVATLVTGEPV